LPYFFPYWDIFVLIGPKYHFTQIFTCFVNPPCVEAFWNLNKVMAMDHKLQIKTSRAAVMKTATDKLVMLKTLVLLTGLLVLIISIRGMSGL